MFNSILGFFKKIFKPSVGKDRKEMAISLREAKMMAEMIAATQEVELTCDEVFELLDQFTELAVQGEDVAHLMPLVHRHLEMCPECREEYETLRSLLEARLN
ncbi:MAG: hypothetical protein AB1457_07475 [Chloroflexota bacterium]|nr:MAG: hypothetical protein KatS3mg045_1748 [Bellilinea sp.]